MVENFIVIQKYSKTPGTMSKKQPIDVKSPFGQAVNSCQRKTDFDSRNLKEQTLRNLLNADI